MAMDELSALADRTRRTIIGRLRMGPKSVGQIAKNMKVSRSAVSQGLKILFDAELVKREIRGRKVFYSLAPKGFERLRTFIEGIEDVIEKYGHRRQGE